MAFTVDSIRGMAATVRRVATAVRADGIYNTATGLGSGKDVAFDIGNDDVLTYQDVQKIYRHVGLAKRAVDLPVTDALSKGYKIQISTGGDDALSRRWIAEQRRLRINERTMRCAKDARWSGAGYMMAVTQDGKRPDQPLDLNSLQAVWQFVAFNAGECQPDKIGVMTGIGSSFLDPIHYRITVPASYRHEIGALPGDWAEVMSGRRLVHHTRIIRIVGEELTREDAVSHWAEGDSVIQAMFRELGQVSQMPNAAFILAQEMKLDVVKVPGLDAIAASDQAETFEQRMRLMKLGKSLLGLIMLGNGEEFESRQSSVSGFGDLAKPIGEAFVAVTGIPRAVFYGESSAGMSGDAGIESETYSNLLLNQWATKLTPALERIYQIVRAQKVGPYLGDHEVMFQIVPRALRDERPKEVYARRLIIAQTLSILKSTAGLPTSYLQELFKAPGGWSDELPPFDPDLYEPDEPLPDDKGKGGSPAFGGSKSPNKAGANAPGQIPADPTKAITPNEAGAQGVDTQVNNTGLG